MGDLYRETIGSPRRTRYDGVYLERMQDRSMDAVPAPDQPVDCTDREALRELLPYVALGWGPEDTSGEGLLCAVRALANAIQNFYKQHSAHTGYLPTECSFEKLAGILRSAKYLEWRYDRLQAAIGAAPELAFTEFSATDNMFSVDDLRYLLGYLNSTGNLVSRFRLGVVATYRTKNHNGGHEDTMRTNIMIYPHLAPEEDHADPVLWVRNLENVHWESIGPRPNLDGLQDFKDLGLEEEAKQVVKSGLYMVSTNSEYAQPATVATEVPFLLLDRFRFIYEHNMNRYGIIPKEYTPQSGWFWGMTARSKVHDKYDVDCPPAVFDNSTEGLVRHINMGANRTTGAVVELDTYPCYCIARQSAGGLVAMQIWKDKYSDKIVRERRVGSYYSVDDELDPRLGAREDLWWKEGTEARNQQGINVPTQVTLQMPRPAPTQSTRSHHSTDDTNKRRKRPRTGLDTATAATKSKKLRTSTLDAAPSMYEDLGKSVTHEMAPMHQHIIQDMDKPQDTQEDEAEGRVQMASIVSALDNRAGHRDGIRNVTVGIRNSLQGLPSAEETMGGETDTRMRVFKILITLGRKVWRGYFGKIAPSRIYTAPVVHQTRASVGLAKGITGEIHEVMRTYLDGSTDIAGRNATTITANGAEKEADRKRAES